MARGRNNVVLVKLEGHNPGGSVKDRPAFVDDSLRRGARRYSPGDTPIEPTRRQHWHRSGHGGGDAGLSYGAVMPENSSAERGHHEGLWRRSGAYPSVGVDAR